MNPCQKCLLLISLPNVLHFDIKEFFLIPLYTIAYLFTDITLEGRKSTQSKVTLRYKFFLHICYKGAYINGSLALVGCFCFKTQEISVSFFS